MHLLVSQHASSYVAKICGSLQTRWLRPISFLISSHVCRTVQTGGGARGARGSVEMYVNG